MPRIKIVLGYFIPLFSVRPVARILFWGAEFQKSGPLYIFFQKLTPDFAMPPGYFSAPLMPPKLKTLATPLLGSCTTPPMFFNISFTHQF